VSFIDHYPLIARQIGLALETGARHVWHTDSLTGFPILFFSFYCWSQNERPPAFTSFKMDAAITVFPLPAGLTNSPR
jgi:hypothetical protein